ncbi:MAG: hypothetical protein WDN28_26465 [Chthoniobacter sp.]
MLELFRRLQWRRKHSGFCCRKENVTLREAALLLCDWFQLPTQEKPARPAKDAGEPPTSDAPSKAERSPKASKAKGPNPDDTGPNKPLGFALQNHDPAHPYLAERGLSAETIAEFGLGYCQNGSMTGRIVVPIQNAEGQLVAYAGRWPGTPPDEDTPKYKHPPGFHKAQEIFNLHRAMREPAECAPRDRRRILRLHVALATRPPPGRRPHGLHPLDRAGRTPHSCDHSTYSRDCNARRRRGGPRRTNGNHQPARLEKCSSKSTASSAKASSPTR